jgi:UDP-N-acetylmuramoylalanine-D-glutamate ligase
MKLVGVTGTNGKTTVATLLFKLFTQLGYIPKTPKPHYKWLVEG